jgi:hypothetical protein
MTLRAALLLGVSLPALSYWLRMHGAMPKFGWTEDERDPRLAGVLTRVWQLDRDREPVRFGVAVREMRLADVAGVR